MRPSSEEALLSELRGSKAGAVTSGLSELLDDQTVEDVEPGTTHGS